MHVKRFFLHFWELTQLWCILSHVPVSAHVHSVSLFKRIGHPFYLRMTPWRHQTLMQSRLSPISAAVRVSPRHSATAIRCEIWTIGQFVENKFPTVHRDSPITDFRLQEHPSQSLRIVGTGRRMADSSLGSILLRFLKYKNKNLQ